MNEQSRNIEPEVLDKAGFPDYACMKAKLKERIKELEAELEKHRWIPVTERLPENIADVFILTDKESGGIGFYGEDENGYRWERLDHALNLKITHWKPIVGRKLPISAHISDI